MKFIEVLVTFLVLLSGVSSHFWVYRLPSKNKVASVNNARYQFFTTPPENCDAVRNVKMTPGIDRTDSKVNRKYDQFGLRGKEKADAITWTNDMGQFGMFA